MARTNLARLSCMGRAGLLRSSLPPLCSSSSTSSSAAVAIRVKTGFMRAGVAAVAAAVASLGVGDPSPPFAPSRSSRSPADALRARSSAGSDSVGGTPYTNVALIAGAVGSGALVGGNYYSTLASAGRTPWSPRGAVSPTAARVWPPAAPSAAPRSPRPARRATRSQPPLPRLVAHLHVERGGGNAGHHQ